MSDKVTLTSPQRDELIEQYVEIVVDNMDTKSLVQFVTEELANYYDQLSDIELKEQIISTHEEELYDELVDNVTNEIAPAKVILTDDDYDTFSDKVVTCEELEEQSIKDYDDDYADKVDTLVGNMVASDDNVFTHDSEGC